METKQSAGATQCWRKIKVWKEGQVSLFPDHENVTVSRVQGLEAGDIYCVLISVTEVICVTSRPKDEPTRLFVK